jgi:hypothetical protein
MKYIRSFVLLMLIACNNSSPYTATAEAATTAVCNPAARMHNRQYYVSADTVVIISASGYDTLKYAKNDFTEIIDHFPELHEKIPLHPDIAYQKSGALKTSTGNTGLQKLIDFRSELGQDVFCILYAHLLKPQNSYAAMQREKLRKSYHVINHVFHAMNGFGTYYDHQYRRIQAYAAYDTYNYSASTENDLAADIHMEKKYFIESLKRQLISTIKTSNDILSAESKNKIQRELLSEINQLDTLISTQYILHRVCEFRYSFYQ